MPSDVVDRREIGFAVLFRGRADANENCVAIANRLAGIGGVRDVAGLAGGFQDVVEVMLVDGDISSIELGNSIRVDVGANDLMARFREAGTGDEADITTTNDTKVQGASPVKLLNI